MREKRTFVVCARKLPYLRNCNGCKHSKTCSLYWVDDIENHEEKALIGYQEEQKEFANF